MICNECGASIQKEDAECPFCGALQYNAAEQEYMNKLGEVKQNLGNINIEGNKTFTKIFFLTLLKTSLLSLVFIVLGFAINWYEEIDEESSAMEDVKQIEKRYVWYDENIDNLNDYFKNREFDKITEVFNQEWDYRALVSWEHGDISKLYIDITNYVYKAIKDIEEGTIIIETEMEHAINASLELIYACDEDNIYHAVSISDLDNIESELLKEWRTTAYIFLYEVLEMSEDEVLKAKEQAYDGMEFCYFKLSDIALERLNKLEIE